MAENGGDSLAQIELAAQQGDEDAQLDAALAYMSENKPNSVEKAIYWIRKVFLTHSTRVTPDQIITANPISLDVRAKTIVLAKGGESLVDMILRTSACTVCRDNKSDKALIGMEGTKFYRTVWDLIAWALLSSCSIQPAEEDCSICHSPLQMLFVDYHHFVKEAGEDLVVRCLTFGAEFHKRYSLLWFDGQHYRVVSQEDVRDQDKVDVDYFTRSINLYAAQGNYEDAAAAAKLALQQFPGDPALLNVVTGLLNGGKGGICEAIVDMHLAKQPEDPLGLLFKSELLLHNYRIGTPPKQELLKEADKLVQKAMKLSGRADWQEAELLQCDIARLSKVEPDRVESLYLALTSKYPKFPAAKYGLGLHYLDTKPELAAQQFAAGESLMPTDPLFLFGQVRALIKATRYEQAAAILERAKPLNPNHPLLRILADEIKKSSSNGDQQEHQRFH